MDYSRQKAVFNNELFNTPVHVIGAGATGSWVVLMLAKMGVKKIHVWDFDTVAEHNIPNQAFKRELIGKSKVNAIMETVDVFDECALVLHDEMVTADTRLYGVVFMLTDTMSSRKEIWEGAIKNKINVKLLIETRMDLRGGFVYVINPTSPKQIKEYEESFYTDDEAEVSACGASQTLIATAMQISSVAVWQMINYSNGKDMDNLICISSEDNNALNFKW